MGSSWSGNAELPGSSSIAAPANPPAKASAPASLAQDSAFKNCWSCHLLSGSALLGAGTYVYLLARRPMKQGMPPNPGAIAQMVVGISIACWGVVVLADPRGKSYRVV
ncbi:distal membrane-arm assembly complex protein 1-like [Peromyscus californicus insignis]|uniref:distal membrane-arm assembly complex protein 1-like n=1 Tax=Peromyscus californicus insignis TaxID=564181 RepID=UPI0022A6B8BB|nr:distal membrane-arm assembly complex protein 1-like [Peromyscus californicus insignis]